MATLYTASVDFVPDSSGADRDDEENGTGRSMTRHPCVYILASHRNGTLYIGVTSNLIKRIHEHRTDFIAGFTRRYGLHTLVWYEQHAGMESAIQREKSLKEWQRGWKLRLIEQENPLWLDLHESLARDP